MFGLAIQLKRLWLSFGRLMCWWHRAG